MYITWVIKLCLQNRVDEINQIYCKVNESKVNQNEIIENEIEKALMVRCGGWVFAPFLRQVSNVVLRPFRCSLVIDKSEHIGLP